jgi:hypothetical protein
VNSDKLFKGNFLRKRDFGSFLEYNENRVRKIVKSGSGREMIRIPIAFVLSFLLLIFESLIVMHFKGYHTIEYGGVSPFINVWAMNFFLVYAILSQIINWYETREVVEKVEKDHF